MGKKSFRIACDWSVYGIAYVEADSLEEAVRIAIEDAPLPEDPEYLDDSFTVNKDMTDHFFEEDHKSRQ